MDTIHEFLFAGDVEGLAHMLNRDPSLASDPVPLPDNQAKEHPLHRICDGVFGGHYSEQTGMQLAKLFISYGANVNVERVAGTDSPLTAACSLRCDNLALFYIEQGARIHHRGCHGGTALHWASWCGRDLIVQKLLAMDADINERCIDFKSTPLFWAIHGYRFGGMENLHRQITCARLLLDDGADPSIPNFEGFLPEQLLREDDKEVLELFRGRRPR